MTDLTPEQKAALAAQHEEAVHFAEAYDLPSDMPPGMVPRMIRAVRIQQVARILEQEGCHAAHSMRIAQRLADIGLLAVPELPPTAPSPSPEH